MTALSQRIREHLEPFVVSNVRQTGVTLGNGAYGSVEEVTIPGAVCAAKKLHAELLKNSTPEQVLYYVKSSSRCT